MRAVLGYIKLGGSSGKHLSPPVAPPNTNTDNLITTSNLLEKYPSDWELGVVCGERKMERQKETST